MNKRTWIYVQNPTEYGILCNECGGSKIEWSEYEHKIWCYDCQKDLDGTGGIFDGPIPMQLTALCGTCFDRINLVTDTLEWVYHNEEKKTIEYHSMDVVARNLLVNPKFYDDGMRHVLPPENGPKQ